MPPIRGPEEAQIISSSVRKAWTKPKLAALLCVVGILIAALYTMFGVSESSASFPVQNRDTGRIVGWRSISYRASLRMTDMSRCRYPTRQHLTGSLAELAKAAFIDVRQQHAARDKAKPPGKYHAEACRRHPAQNDAGGSINPLQPRIR
jgi:hypothetical protein